MLTPSTGVEITGRSAVHGVWPGGTGREPVGEGAFLGGLDVVLPLGLPLYHLPVLVLANAAEQCPAAGEAVDVDQLVSVTGADPHPRRGPLTHLR